MKKTKKKAMSKKKQKCKSYNKDYHLQLLLRVTIYCIFFTENECTTYRVLDSADRSKTNVNTVSQGDKCDHWNSGFVRNAWYRFTGAAGQTMADECVQAGSCQTTMAGWMNGTHPKVCCDVKPKGVQL